MLRRYRPTLRFWLIVGGLAVPAATALYLFGTPSLCAGVESLLEHSEEQFAAITTDEIPTEPGQLPVSFVLADASQCAVYADVENAEYLCRWEFPAGSEQAREMYDQSLEEVRECVGDATETEDRSVNHPDYYESVNFANDTGQVGVSLKNKNALQSIHVSVSVEGAPRD